MPKSFVYYVVECYERQSLFPYCATKHCIAKRVAMYQAARLAQETAGQTGYDVVVSGETPVGDVPIVIARWTDGRRVTV